MIRENIQRVQENITAVCNTIGIDPQHITLVGVTKYAETAHIQEALDAGLKDIAENKVQEAQRKFPELKLSEGCCRHMIGHLQSNKVKQALAHFDLIQSVDSLKLAAEIDKQSAKLDQTTPILIQVNTSGEEQKYGIAPENVEELLENIIKMPHVHVQGLMTMAPFTEEESIIRDCFRGLKNIFEDIKMNFMNAPNISMQHLSMGMSGDYTIALEEGSNMVRIGSAIFR
tara:strand:+ start:75 stop:761 length:687 start_codon:yes stop_codon:yes gene_type:complete